MAFGYYKDKLTRLSGGQGWRVQNQELHALVRGVDRCIEDASPDL